ncbi:MAG: hypothetical protein ACR2OR_13850 [Hyphomicrobiales bacterium]
MISAVVEAAFGQSDEAVLVVALRRSDDAILSLVAVKGGEIAGHICFQG